jgi:hypothetical protein
LRIDRTNFALAASKARARFYRIAAPAGKLRFGNNGQKNRLHEPFGEAA